MWTKWAWNSMKAGHSALYGFLFVVWCLSYIEDPFFQEALWWSYIATTFTSFLLAIWINVAFFVGGATEGGLFWNYVWVAIYDVLFLIYHGVTYWKLIPQMDMYYRWMEILAANAFEDFQFDINGM